MTHLLRFLLVCTSAVLALGCTRQAEEPSKPNAPSAAPKVEANRDMEDVLVVLLDKGNPLLIDLTTLLVARPLALQGGAVAMSLDRDADRLWFLTRGTGELVSFDTRDDEPDEHLAIGRGGDSLAVDGRKAFLTFTNLGIKHVELIDLDDLQERQQWLAGPALNVVLAPRSKALVATQPRDHQILVMDQQTGQVEKLLDTRERGLKPTTLAVSNDGKQVAVALAYGNTVLILDENLNVQNQIPTGEVPDQLSFSEDDEWLAVVLKRSHAVQILDTETDAVVKEWALPRDCHTPVFGPRDKKLILLCGQTLQVFDTTTGEHTGTLSLPASPKAAYALRRPVVQAISATPAQ